MGFALPGDFLGSPFADRYTCSVDAITEVAAYELLRGRFLPLLQANPKSLHLMLEAASREINAARNHMLLLGCGTAEEKLVGFIIDWRAKVGRGGVLSNLVPLPMSRKDVADFFGLGLTITNSRLSKRVFVRELSQHREPAKSNIQTMLTACCPVDRANNAGPRCGRGSNFRSRRH